MAKAKKSLGGSILETIKTIVYALILAGIFRSLFFQPFWIPSGSMKDTLLIGDFLFVNKMAYGYSYASCPSIIIPRFGINVDAEDFCGFVKGTTNVFLEENQKGVMWWYLDILSQEGIILSDLLDCPEIKFRSKMGK